MTRKLTRAEFISKARLVHKDKYDYSLVNYENNHTYVTIICPKEGHGDFDQIPTSHLRGSGCPGCGVENRANNSRMTKEEFIENARIVHDDKYDYSKVVYKNARTKVIITCLNHGDFPQTPDKHINNSQGCPVCGGKLPSNKSAFIEKARLVHGDKYVYSNVVYKNAKTCVIITCPTHGNFSQRPYSHLSGCGCPRCGDEKTGLALSSDIDCFIQKSNIIHNNFYVYSKVEYNGSDNYVTITCPDHGDFEQTPNSHLRGSGCNDCGKERSRLAKCSNTEKFIENSRVVHGDKYDYSNVEYTNSNTKVIITCPKEGHGDFEQTPNSHLRGSGCNDCGNERSRLASNSNTEVFIVKAKRVHDDTYDYSKTEYVKANTKVIITCPKEGHGDFEQTPNSHLMGHGCPRCINKTEGLLFSILKELFPHYTIPYQVVVVSDGKLKIDFYIVELNLYIELDGDQHFRQISSWDPPEKTQAHDLTKTKRVLKEGQSLVRIYQPWVASDTNNWLEKLKASTREYEKPTVVFIGPEYTYDEHLKDLHYSDLSNKLYETNMIF